VRDIITNFYNSLTEEDITKLTAGVTKEKASEFRSDIAKIANFSEEEIATFVTTKEITELAAALQKNLLTNKELAEQLSTAVASSKEGIKQKVMVADTVASLTGTESLEANPEEAESLKGAIMWAAVGYNDPEKRQKCIEKGAIFDPPAT